MVLRNCLQCGGEFKTYNYQIKRGGGKFCSISCGTTYRNLKDNPAWKPEVRKKISENHADVSGENNPMFGMKGDKAPSYIDGRTQHAGETYRKIALVHLEHKCSRCEETDMTKIDTHHKDGNRKNNDISNLEFLCKKCHLNIAHKYERDTSGRFVSSSLNLKESDNYA